MALVSCPECSAPVARNAASCPRCGEPDPSRKKSNSKRLTQLVGLAFLVIVALGVLWFDAIPQIQRSSLFNHTSQR